MYQMQAADFNSPGPKRPRTGAKVEGDWTCPNCGNINFAFRTTCNMRKCSTPKPGENPIVPVTQMQAYNAPLPIYEQPPTPQYVGGPGAPPMSGYVQAPSYSPQMMVNPSVAPFTGAAPPTYPPQGGYMPVMNGMQGPGYGAPPIDNYGMSRGPPVMDGPPLGRGPLSYNSPQDAMRKRRGGPESGSDGDWTCPKCGNTNFAFRTVCNMRKCSEPKPVDTPPPYHGGQVQTPRFVANGGPARPSPAQSAPPDGSWTCKACGNVNYPFRTHCNRRNCGVEKPTESEAPGTAAEAE